MNHLPVAEDVDVIRGLQGHGQILLHQQDGKPLCFRSETILPTSFTILGDSPSEGSSIRISRGLDIAARADGEHLLLPSAQKGAAAPRPSSSGLGNSE